MRAVNRRGRRPGASTTREQLIDAARELFAERGYDAATTREIAARAGVDPGMIRHHFGSKEHLFLTSLEGAGGIVERLQDVLDGPVEGMAEVLLRRVLSLWDSPVSSAGIAIIRSATQHEWAAKLARDFVLKTAIRPVIARVEADPDVAAVRAALVASQMGGLLLMRYVLKVEPLASAGHDAIVAAIAPTLHRYLTGPVPVFGPAVDARVTFS
jgi:AcrR family transcriptional regulator